MTDFVGADSVEVVVSSDGKQLWVHKDGDTVLRVAQIQKLNVRDDRSTTFQEMIEYLTTELRQLRLDCSQYSESQRRKVQDAHYERRYTDSHKAQGRKEVYDQIFAKIDRIMHDYKLER